jgi:hypothetical protein
MGNGGVQVSANRTILSLRNLREFSRRARRQHCAEMHSKSVLTCMPPNYPRATTRDFSRLWRVSGVRLLLSTLRRFDIPRMNHPYLFHKQKHSRSSIHFSTQHIALPTQQVGSHMVHQCGTKYIKCFLSHCGPPKT